MALDNKTQRFQVTLPTTTVKMIDEVRQQEQFRSLSEFLNKAARFYAVRLKKASLKRQLRAGYQTRFKRDSELIREWETASSELLWDSLTMDRDQK